MVTSDFVRALKLIRSEVSLKGAHAFKMKMLEQSFTVSCEGPMDYLNQLKKQGVKICAKHPHILFDSYVSRVIDIHFYARETYLRWNHCIAQPRSVIPTVSSLSTPFRSPPRYRDRASNWPWHNRTDSLTIALRNELGSQTDSSLAQ